VTDELRSKVEQLAEAISEAVDAVDAALEEKTRERINNGHDKLNAAVSLYDEVIKLADPQSKQQIEMRHGRKITDLKRQVGRMPRGAQGRTAELAKDAGHVPFIEQRAPGRSMQEFAPPRRGEKPKYSVGGEVEAWCGPCGGMRTHNIFALVDGEPDVVICQSCGGRHGFRTTPARKATGLPEGPTGPIQRKQAEQARADQDRKTAEQNALRKELNDAQNVRQFSPKERYKAGEIIEHPEHGRGKVENTTRGSILVRFSHGLRPLDLN
jgi:hypothetical protein